jgi:aspartyl-tRNA(Asn)/glutamyl-tRNA(Gln) amidotransferase subunit B
LTQVGLKLANERGGTLSDAGLDSRRVAALAKMVEDGKVNASAANTIMEHMADADKDPASLAQELNLVQQSDAGELEGLVDQVLADHAQAVADVRAGGKKCKKARGFLLGQVMQMTKGQANPAVVSEILGRKIG